jgi:hypothetical protein
MIVTSKFLLRSQCFAVHGAVCRSARGFASPCASFASRLRKVIRSRTPANPIAFGYGFFAV